MIRIKNKCLFLCSLNLFLFFSSCSKKEKDINQTALIAPEDVMNISAAKKAKAKITGERIGVEVGNKNITDVWTIIYKDNTGTLHSTILRKQPNESNKMGDSISIYYDDTNPQSLPIYESQYLKLTQ